MATLPERPQPSRKNVRTPLDCTIHFTDTAPQRKRGNALKRFRLYEEGLTVQGYLDRGGIPWDVWYDQQHGYIELRNPDGTVFERTNHRAPIGKEGG